eukprot:scpid88984/ scgid26758/ 
MFPAVSRLSVTSFCWPNPVCLNAYVPADIVFMLATYMHAHFPTCGNSGFKFGRFLLVPADSMLLPALEDIRAALVWEAIMCANVDVILHTGEPVCETGVCLVCHSSDRPCRY